jgi:uncharacterized membrane protein
MRHIEEQAPQSGSGLERLVFFSDAIFAISITLLVLPLAETHISDTRALEQFVDLLPEIGTFALSFAVIGMFWLQHHRYFRDIAAFDTSLLQLNLAFLFCIVFLPFPTATLARAGDSPTVTAVYAGTVVTTSSIWTLTWWYASREGRLLEDGVPRARVVYRLLGATSPIVVFTISVPIAFIDPDAAKLSWIAAWPLALLLDRVQRRRLHLPPSLS